MAYQTRDEDGNIKNFNTFEQAYQTWKNAKISKVWKISFDGQRWRSTTKHPRDQWDEPLEQKLCELSDVYKNTTDWTKVFWVHQANHLEENVIENLCHKLKNQQITEEEYDKAYEELYNIHSIKAVMTDEEFVTYGKSK